MKSRSKPAQDSKYRPLPVKPYGGVAAVERQEQRRERLIEAAIELFGSIGYAKCTIQAICDKAGCALRTFYEEFGSREALLLVVYERVSQRFLDATFSAVEAESRPSEIVRTGIRAYVAALTSDSKRARIMLIEAVGVSSSLDTARREAMAGFMKRVAIAATRFPVPFDGDDFELVSMALIGSADQLATAWVVSKGKLSAERMVDALITIWTRTLRIV